MKRQREAATAEEALDRFTKAGVKLDDASCAVLDWCRPTEEKRTALKKLEEHCEVQETVILALALHCAKVGETTYVQNAMHDVCKGQENEAWRATLPGMFKAAVGNAQFGTLEWLKTRATYPVPPGVYLRKEILQIAIRRCVTKSTYDRAYLEPMEWMIERLCDPLRNSHFTQPELRGVADELMRIGDGDEAKQDGSREEWSQLAKSVRLCMNHEV